VTINLLENQLDLFNLQPLKNSDSGSMAQQDSLIANRSVLHRGEQIQNIFRL
jgi:hypothetical protein